MGKMVCNSPIILLPLLEKKADGCSYSRTAAAITCPAQMPRCAMVLIVIF
jgi:hypothetical protein